MKSSSLRSTFYLVGISCLVVRAASPSFTMDYGAHRSTTLSSPSLVPASDTGTFTYYGFSVTNCAEKIECVSGVSTNGASVFHPIQVSFDVTGTKCELIVNNIVDFTTGTSSLAIAFWELTDGQTTSAFDSCVLGNSDFTTQYIPVTFAANTTHHLLFSIHGNFGGVNVTGGNNGSRRQFLPCRHNGHTHDWRRRRFGAKPHPGQQWEHCLHAHRQCAGCAQRS